MRAGLCELCGQRQAEFVVCKVSGDRRRDERRLCAKCTGDRERIIYGNSGLLLSELLGIRISKLSASNKEQNRTKVCPNCGNTIENAKQTGMLGCPTCYIVFEEEITPIISELHGYTLSRGKPL